MGCGCSMHNKRVAAAQKEKHDTTSVAEIGDAGQNTPATVVNEQEAAPEPAPPKKDNREFLQGMSPPCSPDGLARKDSPVVLASSPLLVGSGTVSTETGSAPPAALPVVELGKGDDSGVPRANDGVVAVPSVGASSGGRPAGGGGELLEVGEGGGGARATGRSVQPILRPGELTERPRRFSNQDPLPQLAQLPAASADLSSVQHRGHTLGPGLDIAFREEPTSIVPTAIADDPASGESSSSGNGNTSTRDGVRSTPVDQGRHKGGVGSARHANKGGHGNSDELIVTPVTPDDEDMMSDRGAPAKDRWPRNGDTPTSGRHHDRTADNDGTPPRHEARPPLAAESSEAVPQAANRSIGGRGGLSSVDFTGDGNYNLSPATGGMGSAGDEEAWGATSGAYSLLDADEEDFMETLLMES